MVALDLITGFSLLIPIASSLYIFTTSHKHFLTTFGVILASGILAYKFTTSLIPVVKEFTLKAGLSGKDINKKGTAAGEKDVPESLGIVPGTIFILVNMIALGYTRFFLSKELFIEHLSALLSITFCIFLGFCDDVLDLKWRYKIILPTIASLPLLLAYTGPTTILVPAPLSLILGNLLDLGLFYYLYMGMLAVFCMNAINIYAGINGLEVGQSVIIGCFIAAHNAIEIYYRNSTEHFFSLMIMIPFIFVSLGLLKFNKFPSMVFVGDTYCYFAGMTFAVCGILAHFSKALLLFFIPQLINFGLSIPQLIGIIPCPRHRLPKYNTETGKVEGKPENWNLLNVYLRIAGPQTEKDTTNQLMIFQVACNLAALIAIHYAPNILF